MKLHPEKICCPLRRKMGSRVNAESCFPHLPQSYSRLTFLKSHLRQRIYQCLFFLFEVLALPFTNFITCIHSPLHIWVQGGGGRPRKVFQISFFLAGSSFRSLPKEFPHHMGSVIPSAWLCVFVVLLLGLFAFLFHLSSLHYLNLRPFPTCLSLVSSTQVPPLPISLKQEDKLEYSLWALF